MLKTLTIKNVALIKDLTIDFGKGFNVLIGETGAGKSIIFDSLNFVLGGKADKSLLRSGENEMRVTAIFANSNASVNSFLDELEIDDKEEIMISRTLNLDGKASIRVNGLPMTLALVKKLGTLLVDSYSQHEGVALLQSKNHLSMLDKFGGEEIEQLKNAVASEYEQLNNLKKKLAELGGDAFERERAKSLLEYQIDEIAKAELQVGEDEEIKEKLNFISNSEKIFESLSNCLALLDGSTSSSLSLIEEGEGVLSGLSNFAEIEDCRNRLISARYEIDDIVETLRGIKDNLSFDEREFDRLDRRYDLLKLLMKKYGGTVEQVLQFYEEAKNKFDQLCDAENLSSKYEKQIETQKKLLSDLCGKLSAKRKEVASLIEEKIVLQLRELGMKSTIFKVNFNAKEISENGIDDVEFAFSANKGQEIKSLAKTASGGEMSRFMLALKNIFAEIGSARTLIFDEIDSGISGETGNIVGNKIHALTSFAQVICITHLPQVAAFGDEFLFVSKLEDSTSTFTQIKSLSEKEIDFQIARMIGGDNVSQVALNHAKEMRAKAHKI